MDIQEIRKLCEADSIRWTDHVVKRLIKRGITRLAVKQAISNGDVIEDYPDDYPYPSCLVLGTFDKSESLHVVCGIGDGELWIITAYIPNPEEWTDGFRVRKEPE